MVGPALAVGLASPYLVLLFTAVKPADELRPRQRG